MAPPRNISMHDIFSIFLLPLIVLHNAHLVHAHGYVSKVSIDGKIYTGNVPNASPTPAIVRQIDDVAPVKNATNPYLNCGQAAQKASLVADANPGSQVQFWWNGGDGSPVSPGLFIRRLICCLAYHARRFVHSGRITLVRS